MGVWELPATSGQMLLIGVQKGDDYVCVEGAAKCPSK